MAETRPPLTATLEWDGELQFTGFVGKHEVSIDGNADASPTPVHLLALSLAGCMAIDLVHILERGRHPATSLTAAFTGERAPDDPKRFTKIRLEFTLTGSMQPEHVERAIQLSRDKYCSVWNTFRQDIDLDVAFTIAS
ncbi:MAG TPA: OsmC family protein [Vicinamibacterales bacterium]|jgi:putative redox protein